MMQETSAQRQYLQDLSRNRRRRIRCRAWYLLVPLFPGCCPVCPHCSDSKQAALGTPVRQAQMWVAQDIAQCCGFYRMRLLFCVHTLQWFDAERSSMRQAQMCLDQDVAQYCGLCRMRPARKGRRVAYGVAATMSGGETAVLCLPRPTEHLYCSHVWLLCLLEFRLEYRGAVPTETDAPLKTIYGSDKSPEEGATAPAERRMLMIISPERTGGFSTEGEESTVVPGQAVSFSVA